MKSQPVLSKDDPLAVSPACPHHRLNVLSPIWPRSLIFSFNGSIKIVMLSKATVYVCNQYDTDHSTKLVPPAAKAEDETVAAMADR